MRTVAVIGGGAAGCFAAVELKRRCPRAEVTVYEAGKRLMTKLGITGGGKCNITNTFESVRSIADVYPRGGRLMERLFYSFSPEDTMEWWENEGVKLTVLEEGRVFTASMDAGQVVSTLSRLMTALGVRTVTGRRIGDISELSEDILIVTAGGGEAGITGSLGIDIVPSVPSLFTFRINDRELCSMSGISVHDAVLTLTGTGLRSTGDLLVTDWGMSGPATLKLSSYAARHLAENGYKAVVSVNWSGKNEEETREEIRAMTLSGGQKQLGSVHPDNMPSRLWRHLLHRSGVSAGTKCAEVGKKHLSAIVAALTCDNYEICGRAKFKEEFVTCGGIALSAVRQDNLESKTNPGVFFAGEILDIDAVTGGFNLQAAWTTAFVAARAAAEMITR